MGNIINSPVKSNLSNKVGGIKITTIVHYLILSIIE